MSGGWQGDDAEPTSTTRLEVENGLRLTDRILSVINDGPRTEPFSMSPEFIRELNTLAVQGLAADAGTFRTYDSERAILGSRHVPPPHSEVPRLVEEMCAHVNDLAPAFSEAEPDEDDYDRGLDVATYVLWRLNWIHPFEDGNGRTSRALCHLLFCIHSRSEVPPFATRILQEKVKYYRCLSEADLAHKTKKKIRLQNLREFVGKHMLNALRALIEEVEAENASLIEQADRKLQAVLVREVELQKDTERLLLRIEALKSKTGDGES